MLKINTAPSSITISDSDNNRVTVLKTKSGFEFYSAIANSAVNKDIVALGQYVQNYITTLIKEKNRDNYGVRFTKLKKLIMEKNAPSFYKLNTKLAAASA